MLIPRFRTLKPAAAALLAFVLAGCATEVRVLNAVDLAPRVPADERLLVENGPLEIEATEASTVSRYGRTYRYEVITPIAGPTGVGTIFIGHGFMRDGATMRGWARWFASHGLRAVVVDFANSSWLGGNHDRNGADLLDLARSLESGARYYAGFSAGGLASLIAAASDDGASAWIGLDPVDSGDLAESALRTLADSAIPALALFAEPSRCNAENNMRGAALTTGIAVIDVADATHCHFESPYDPACENLCGRVEPEEANEVIADGIRWQVARFLLLRAIPAATAAATDVGRVVR